MGTDDLATMAAYIVAQLKVLASLVADRMGKRLITIATNLREIADKRRCDWSRRYSGDFWGLALSGAALAAVGLTVQHLLCRLIIGSTDTYRLLVPWSSHPLLDPLWSTEQLSFEHDGCEVDRVPKIKRIAGSELACKNLPVCYMSSGTLNCCRCEKCLSTMMTLRLCGASETTLSFPEALDLGWVSRLQLQCVHSWRRGRWWPGSNDPVPLIELRWREILAEADQCGDREIAHAIRVALGESYSIRRALSDARRWLRRLLGPGIASTFLQICGRARVAR